MFASLLENWTVNPALAPTFVYYVKRHIALDNRAHGPAAEAIINEVLKDDIDQRRAFEAASLTSVDQRVKLWDALADYMQVPPKAACI